MTVILWILGTSLISFFGTLAVLRFNEWYGARFPLAVFLTAPEVEALKAYRVTLPRKFFRAAHLFGLRLTPDELNQFYSIVMELAQDRIGSAARRNIVTLTGHTRAMGALAGYLHACRSQLTPDEGEYCKDEYSAGDPLAPAPRLPHTANGDDRLPLNRSRAGTGTPR